MMLFLLLLYGYPLVVSSFTCTKTVGRRRTRTALTVLLADDDHLRHLNTTFRGMDTATDVLSFEGGGTPQSYMGTLPAFLAAWGPMDMGFGSGQGVKCYHSEHLYGEFWHRAFIVTPDTPLCNYLISCGSNIEAAGGVTRSTWSFVIEREYVSVTP